MRPSATRRIHGRTRDPSRGPASACRLHGAGRRADCGRGRKRAGADGGWLVVSLDDDAVRLRVVRRQGNQAARLAAAEMAATGVASLRARWLASWNAQVAALVPGAVGYDADTYEFERQWQDVFD